MNKNKEILTGLYNKYGKFHFVYSLYKPTKWKIYPDDLDSRDTDDTLIFHREIMPDEVVFDFDVRDKSKLEYYTKYVRNRLKRHNIAYKEYTTGGKGVHIHTNFPALLEYEADDRKVLKEIIIEYILNGKEVLAGIDFQVCSKHLIRAEYGEHEKTGKTKELLSEYSPVVKGDSEIPQTVLSNFIKTKKIYESRRHDFTTNTKLKAYPCITYILSNDFVKHKEGRKRALKLVCNYMYRTLGEKGINKVFEWNDYKLNRYFSEYKIKSEFKSIQKMVDGGRSFGCRTTHHLLRELGKKDICDECILYKQRNGTNTRTESE